MYGKAHMVTRKMILLWKQPNFGSIKGIMNGGLETGGEIELNMYNMFIAISSESENLHWKVC